MAQLHLPRVPGIPMASPSSADRRLLQILLSAAVAAMLITLGGCAGDRNDAQMDAQRDTQRDTMSHGGTEDSE